MSKLDVSKRFFKALKNKDNHLSVSLPMVCDGREIIFFYYAEGKGAEFSLEELDNVVFRDLATSEITVKKANELISKEGLEKIFSAKKTESVTGDRAIKLATAYYELHEKILTLNFDDRPTDGEAALLREFFKTFKEIVPKGGLRYAYYLLGKNMFDYVAALT